MENTVLVRNSASRISSVRVLFVIPPYFTLNDFLNADRTSVYPQFTIPYGVLSLDSYCKKEFRGKLHTSLVDFNVTLSGLVERGQPHLWETEMEAQLSKELLDFKPEIVAISALFNSSFGYLERIASTIKKSGSCFVVAGGGLPSAA